MKIAIAVAVLKNVMGVESGFRGSSRYGRRGQILKSKSMRGWEHGKGGWFGLNEGLEAKKGRAVWPQRGARGMEREGGLASTRGWRQGKAGQFGLNEGLELFCDVHGEKEGVNAVGITKLPGRPPDWDG